MISFTDICTIIEFYSKDNNFIGFINNPGFIQFIRKTFSIFHIDNLNLSFDNHVFKINNQELFKNKLQNNTLKRATLDDLKLLYTNVNNMIEKLIKKDYTTHKFLYKLNFSRKTKIDLDWISEDSLKYPHYLSSKKIFKLHTF